MSLIEHDKDFFLWTRQQADGLRRLAETRPNAEVDWNNLIDEIEDLGNEQEHAIESHFVVTLVHLLKLAYSPDEAPRRHWMGEIAAQRGSLKRRLRKNPSLRARSSELMAEAYETACRQASLLLGEAAHIPGICPFSLEQVLDDSWFPEATGVDGSVG
jgi:hypothetical protein